MFFCAVSCSIAAVVKTWISGAVVVDLCFVSCALRCVALYNASRKISVMPDGPRQIALPGMRFVWILPSSQRVSGSNNEANRFN